MEASVGRLLELGSVKRESELGFGSAGGELELGSVGRKSELGFGACKLTDVDSDGTLDSPFFSLLRTSLTAGLITRLRGLIAAEKFDADD